MNSHLCVYFWTTFIRLSLLCFFLLLFLPCLFCCFLYFVCLNHHRGAYHLYISFFFVRLLFLFTAAAAAVVIAAFDDFGDEDGGGGGDGSFSIYSAHILQKEKQRLLTFVLCLVTQFARRVISILIRIPFVFFYHIFNSLRVHDVDVLVSVFVFCLFIYYILVVDRFCLVQK